MSAVAEVPLNPLPTPASPNWLQRLSALDRAQRMRLGAGAALLVMVSSGDPGSDRARSWQDEAREASERADRG